MRGNSSLHDTIRPNTGSGMATGFLRALVTLYRWFLSPWLGGHCRFHPSCSEYALEALQCHRPGRALWLILRRLGRCHPFGGSGYDPVPGTGTPAADGAIPPQVDPALASKARHGQTGDLKQPAAAGPGSAAAMRVSTAATASGLPPRRSAPSGPHRSPGR